MPEQKQKQQTNDVDGVRNVIDEFQREMSILKGSLREMQEKWEEARREDRYNAACGLMNALNRIETIEGSVPAGQGLDELELELEAKEVSPGQEKRDEESEQDYLTLHLLAAKARESKLFSLRELAKM